MHEVQLYIYDLSNGLAAQLSVQLTGRFFKAIYHTSIVYSGREYFFGGSGVESSLPAQSPHGIPIERKLMGKTEIEPDLWQQFLQDCAEEYGVGKYHLLEHNCNTFSDAALQFLLGQHVPPEVASLPSDFLNTPLGMMLRTQIDAMYAPRPGAISAVRTEAKVNGPTSGDHRERSSEVYKFLNTPTLAKVFTKLKTQLPDVRLTTIESSTEQLITGQTVSPDDLVCFTDYFVQYFESISPKEIFPGLDLVRIWLTNKKFSQHLIQYPELLSQIVRKDYDDPETSGSLSVFLKLVSNALSDEKLRTTVISLVQQYERLETFSGAVLSNTSAVFEAALKTIWNILILCDGIDQDFKVTCLASVAESRSKEIVTPESKILQDKIIKEILQGGGDEIMDMADILELEI